MPVQMRAADLRRMAKDFRAAGRKDLERDMLKEMRAEVQPLVPRIRSRILATPSSTGDQRTLNARKSRPRGLRDAEARGVQVKAGLTGKQAGVRIRIDPRHFPSGEKALIRYREGTRSRWRARNWGRDDWHTMPAHPVFFETVRPAVPAVQRRLKKVSDDYLARITGGN